MKFSNFQHMNTKIFKNVKLDPMIIESKTKRSESFSATNHKYSSSYGNFTSLSII